MKKNYLNENVKEIINEVINEINIGKSKMFKITDKMNDDLQRKKLELDEIRESLKIILDEVDELRILDKAMRLKLVEESKKDVGNNEENLKKVYEEALDIRVKFITRQKEEKDLIIKRDILERTLKDYLLNIDEAESAVNQINIALGYLEGRLLNTIDLEKEDSKVTNEIRLLESQEYERRRIAREIHDGPAQYIANAMMRVDFCKVVIKKDLDQGLKELEDLKSNIKKALQEVRGIIYDLRPLSLEERGINEAIKEMIHNISIENDIIINSFIEEAILKIDNIIQISIYRIIQEILNNIKKHSKAKVVDIKLNYLEGYILIFIQDDGIGFDVKNTISKNNENNNYGLIGIFERVKLLGGRLEIKSSEGFGTTYKIKLPIERKGVESE